MNRNRLYLLAGAGLAALVVVVVVILVAGGGSSGSTTTSAETTSTSGEPAPSSLFAGIPQQGDTLGKASAPATLLVFEDPQCPYCKEFNLATLPTVVNDFVRTGRVKLAWRGIQIVGPNSEQGLRAIYAAGLQNKLWQMAEAVYERQGAENAGWITDEVIRQSAESAGADGGAVLQDSSSGAVTEALDRALQEANQLGLRGTPSFYVQRPPALPQQVNVTSLEPSAFSAALAAALQ